MAQKTDKLHSALAEPFATPVYYFASTEAPLIHEAAGKVLRALEKAGECDITRLEGPVPDMGEVIAAAGAISFFGTPRVVELRDISPTTMGDKDIDELCTLFGELENAVMVVSSLYKDKKASTGKKAKKLMEAVAAAGGVALEMAKPGRADNLRYMREVAAGLGCEFERGAAELLVDSAGEDRLLLGAETEKLAALCGYKTISVRAVETLSTHNIEADVFELARLICARRADAAFAKLNDLLALRHEPIALAAALSGTYIDMLRVRWGTEAKKTTGQVFKEFGYRGSDYRLKKAKENAARYTTEALEDCVLALRDLDKALKSSALPDKSILLQATVGELIQKGGRR